MGRLRLPTVALGVAAVLAGGLPSVVTAAGGWGEPVGSDLDISPRTATTAPPVTRVQPAPTVVAPATPVGASAPTAGWGAVATESPDISPGRGVLDNPWFRTADFLPDPTQYLAPRKDEVEVIRDTVADPYVVWIETVRSDGTDRRANFKALLIDGSIHVPVIVLPHLFSTKVQWKAAQRRLYVYRGNESLTFSLGEGLRVRFLDDEVDLGARLEYWEGMLFVPVRTLAEFFSRKVVWSSQKKVLTFMPKVKAAPGAPAPATDPFQKKWEETLANYGMGTYARDLGKARPAAVPGTAPTPGTAGRPTVFEKVWATSEEPQRIACKGLRGDWFLRAEDMGCALPSRAVLMRRVRIRHRTTGQEATATVVDVGPWNIDDPYWLKDGGRPDVEGAVYDRRGRKSNLAGIDLAFEVWRVLGVDRATAYGGNYSAFVDWWFVE